MPINYATDRTGGKDAVMNCQCAREVYYATIEKKGYARQQCDGNGNFKAYQSFDNGLNTYCVDENGSRISKIVPSTCFDQFVEDIDPGLVTLREYICVAMRKILTDTIIKPGSFFKFDKGLKDYLPLDDKPLQADLYCSNSQLDACKCQGDSSSVVM